MATVYTSRVEELGASPSTGTVGDSYDCQSVCTQSRKDWGVPDGAV